MQGNCGYGILHDYENVCIVFAFVVILIILLMVDPCELCRRILITCVISNETQLSETWISGIALRSLYFSETELRNATDCNVCVCLSVQLRLLYFRTLDQCFSHIYWWRSVRNLHHKHIPNLYNPIQNWGHVSEWKYDVLCANIHDRKLSTLILVSHVWTTSIVTIAIATGLPQYKQSLVGHW